MFLKSLNLQNFRSYIKSEFNFSPDTTVIVGPNTSGKTNILEAVYLLCTGKSFRIEKDYQMISFGKDLGRVKGEIIDEISNLKSQISNKPIKDKILNQVQNDESNGEKTELEIVLTGGEVGGIKTPFKKFLVNGVSKSRITFSSNLACIIFSPQDLDIITGSPSLRRNFMDQVLEQVDREYKQAIISYSKALRRRNALLERAQESGVRNERQFEYWDELLIKNGQYITKKRHEFLEFINSSKKEIFNISVVYDKSEISRERLLQYKDAELGSGVTLVGPHRDDVFVRMSTISKRHAEFISASNLKILNYPKGTSYLHSGAVQAFGSEAQVFDSEVAQTRGARRDDTKNSTAELVEVKSFGSRGQQRLAILQLKLLQLLYIEKEQGIRPMLLLDDIFSELDADHINLVLKEIPKQQTIITTTHKEFLGKLSKGLSMIELKINS